MRNLDPFEPECFYHIFNRTNNRELLFPNEEDYNRFLNIFFFRMGNFIQCYAYCLIPNHFHFLCSLKKESEIQRFLKSLPLKEMTSTRRYFINGKIDISVLVLQEFSNFFNSYSKSSNLRWNRTGNLFNRRFRRKRIDAIQYLRHAIRYIHTNAAKHQLVKDFRDYRWTSYHEMLLTDSEKLETEYIMNLFGNRNKFIRFHLREEEIDNELHVYLEEEQGC